MMSQASGGTGLGLSLVGMRIAPRDPSTKEPKVGIKQEVVKVDYSMSSFN